MAFKRIASFIQTRGMSKSRRTIGNKNPQKPKDVDVTIPPAAEPKPMIQPDMNSDDLSMGMDVDSIKRTMDRPAPRKKSSTPSKSNRRI